MPFYLRKSVRVGPLRFNLSQSGIGVSTGIPGFRIGVGPRGNYVHAGRGGVYYRATLPPGNNAPPRPRYRDTPASQTGGGNRATVGPEQEIESGSALAMRDESAAGLLAELNEKRRRWRIGPVVLLLAGVIDAALWNRLHLIGQIAVVAAGAISTFACFFWDTVRKTTVVMYDLDADAAASYQGLVAAVEEIGHAHRLWHVVSKADVLDRKYHAGAQSEIRRTSTRVTVGSMPLVKCNVDVPSLAVGRQSLYFLPDRLLVFDSSPVGAIGYSALGVERRPTRFIEDESVPSDSRVVDRTWRYVNKKGGPDRRFKDNPELPICEYEAIHFQSASGLNELVHASRVGVADALVRYLASEGPRLGQTARGSEPNVIAT